MFRDHSYRQTLKKLMPASALEVLYSLKYSKHKLADSNQYQSLLKNKQGIEIGGPSIVFKYVLPVYDIISNLDGVNFATTTMWEGDIKDGTQFRYFKNRVGEQFISEATELKNIQSNSYDFLLSSNCLEHVANPLKAIEEWIRVIKPEGCFLLVLPKKEANFDHKRPITTFEHLLADYKNNMSEHDLTHLDEILELHDLTRDHAAGGYEKFKARSLDNFSNRGLHHHVFDAHLIRQLFEYFNIDVLLEDETTSDYYTIGKVNKS